MDAPILHVVVVGLFIASPAIIIFALSRIRFLGFLNPIIACYIIGIAVGNTGILPEAASPTLSTMATAAVAISIPLMLFSVNLARLKKIAGTAGISMVLAVIAIIAASFICHILFRGKIEDGWKIAGLVVGVYTGGTPNIAAIRTGLQVKPSVYIAVNTSDIFLSGIYLLFVVTLAKPLIGKLLRPFAAKAVSETGVDGAYTEGSYEDIPKKGNRLPLLGALGLALAVAAVGFAVSLVIPGEFSSVVAILTITTLAIGLSMVPAVRKIRLSFKLGEYIILIFCLVVGSTADIRQFITVAPQIILYVAIALFGSVVLHALLCKLFKVDVDTMIITSTSAICSPPFVGMAAAAIKNKAIVAAGISTGIIGFAIGNYLGILLAQLYRLI